MRSYKAKAMSGRLHCSSAEATPERSPATSARELIKSKRARTRHEDALLSAETEGQVAGKSEWESGEVSMKGSEVSAGKQSQVVTPCAPPKPPYCMGDACTLLMRRRALCC